MQQALEFIQIHTADNVLIALRDFEAGEIIHYNKRQITLQQAVQRGHKIAIQSIEKGENIVKYGFPIGHALTTIHVGEWIHSHNLKTNLQGELAYDYQKQLPSYQPIEAPQKTFKGYHRSDGKVGIRNEIWIINTVGCINKVAENLATAANKIYQASNFDGVHSFAHPYGCSQLGDDLVYTQKILSALIHHPNAGGVLVLGLGCENNYIDLFKEEIGQYDEQRVRFLNVQSIEDEMEVGLDLIDELFQYVSQFERQDTPISELKIGLKCGGSDGLSGITANPLLGSLSDMVIAAGGSTVLTEVPEMFGAETMLMGRAKDEAIFQQIVSLINDFKSYFIRYNQPIYENPSPGNKEGGITTLEEKSLGCVQKAGFSVVNNVIDYGERLQEHGLTLLQGPGNDLVSVTALAASGCQIVLFTTGRGTPFGGPVPTVKVSTNSQLSKRKQKWIDFNAGRLVEDSNLEQVTIDFFQYLMDLANGEQQAKNETYGFKEIAIFKDGVTM